jgi:hypothetical protein
MNVNLRLPDDVGKQVDVVRGDVPRNTWILRAIEARLRQLDLSEEAK